MMGSNQEMHGEENRETEGGHHYFSQGQLL
jgi:hypothetical protein